MLYQLSYFRKPLTWCPEQDSNLHASRHTHLKRARLPFRHLGILCNTLVTTHKIWFSGAEEETRTRDPHRVIDMLYQLSYFRKYLLCLKQMILELTRRNCDYPLKVALLPIPPFLQKRKPRV